MSSFECYYEYECGKGCGRKDECEWDEEDDKCGPRGPPGKDGENGKPGEQGPPGQDGSSSSSQIALPWSEDMPSGVPPQVGNLIYMLTNGSITIVPDDLNNPSGNYLFGGNAIGILLDQDSPHVSLEEYYSSYVDQSVIDSVDWDDIPVGVVSVPGRRMIGDGPSTGNVSSSWIAIDVDDLVAPPEIINELSGSYMYLN